MPAERPYAPLNPVEAACERLKREKAHREDVQSLIPDRDLTWESVKDNRSFDFDDSYYD